MTLSQLASRGWKSTSAGMFGIAGRAMNISLRTDFSQRYYYEEESRCTDWIGGSGQRSRTGPQNRLRILCWIARRPGLGDRRLRVGAILWDGAWNGCTSLALVLFKIPGWACTVPLVGEEGRQVWWNVKGWDEDSNTSPLGR
jgi:hypothetical protein